MICLKISVLEVGQLPKFAYVSRDRPIHFQRSGDKPEIAVLRFGVPESLLLIGCKSLVSRLGKSGRAELI